MTLYQGSETEKQRETVISNTSGWMIVSTLRIDFLEVSINVFRKRFTDFLELCWVDTL